MGEGEAKTKWCPNTGSTTGDAGRCLGAGCMAWRWDSDEVLAAALGCSGTGALASIPSAESMRGGYCGLAGAPQ